MSDVTFEIIDNGITKPLTYKGDLTVEDFIKDYLKNNTDYVSLSTEVYVFRLGSKILNTEKYLSKKLNEIIRTGCRLTLVRKYSFQYA